VFVGVDKLVTAVDEMLIPKYVHEQIRMTIIIITGWLFKVSKKDAADTNSYFIGTLIRGIINE
jgi:hypothetical protein